jgi:hypothetical protein
VAPRAGSTLKGTVLIAVAAVDDQDALGKLRVIENSAGTQLDLPAAYNPTTQLYWALWNTTRVPDANYNLRAFAVDAQGNRGESRSILVKVDNVP